jgi:hypothetical protein
MEVTGQFILVQQKISTEVCTLDTVTVTCHLEMSGAFHNM